MLGSLSRIQGIPRYEVLDAPAASLGGVNHVPGWQAREFSHVFHIFSDALLEVFEFGSLCSIERGECLAKIRTHKNVRAPIHMT